jgi:hypothetical protein
VHKIRITLASKDMKSVEKGMLSGCNSFSTLFRCHS